MDIKLEKKPWYIRYRYYLMGGLLFAAFLGLSLIHISEPTRRS